MTSLDAYRLLGRSGLRVLPLALGTMTFGKDWGWGADATEARRIFDLYVDHGGNFVDTAVNYTDGASERLLGEFMREKRERLVIATKFTMAREPGNPNSGWRPSPRAHPHRWEFEEDGREFDVAVNPRVTTNDMWVMIRTAVAGGGLTFGMEETFRPYIQRGELAPLLERFCPAFAGFYLYFPDRRNLAPKLRALVSHVRHSTSSSKAQKRR